jgi:hypothetical protein
VSESESVSEIVVWVSEFGIILFSLCGCFVASTQVQADKFSLQVVEAFFFVLQVSETIFDIHSCTGFDFPTCLWFFFKQKVLESTSQFAAESQGLRLNERGALLLHDFVMEAVDEMEMVAAAECDTSVRWIKCCRFFCISVVVFL